MLGLNFKALDIFILTLVFFVTPVSIAKDSPPQTESILEKRMMSELEFEEIEYNIALAENVFDYLDRHELDEDNELRTALVMSYYEFLLTHAKVSTEKIESNTATLEEHNWHVKLMSYIVVLIMFISFIAACAEFLNAYNLRSQSHNRNYEHQISIGLQSLAIKSTLSGLTLFIVSVVLYMVFASLVIPLKVV